ncbi:MAG: hypothetical protein NVS1B10_07660 [Candidatus Saccharimonadales bacterium]
MAGAFFSDPVNSVANSAQPTGQSGSYASIFNPKLWAAKAIEAREPNKILARMCVDYSDDVKGYGDTINIQTIVNLSANAKSDQTQVTLQQPVGSNTQIIINRYYEASFLVERSMAEQSRLNLQEEYVPKAVEIIERKKDNDIASLYSSAANTAAGASGTTAITDPTFINAVQLLDSANVPAEGRHFIGSPSARAALLGISKYLGVIIGTGTTPGFANTTNVVQRGYFGEIYGIPVNFTTNLVNSSGWQNFMFHESAFGLATQIETMVDQNFIPQYLGWLSTASGLWGKAVLRPDHIVSIPSN